MNMQSRRVKLVQPTEGLDFTVMGTRMLYKATAEDTSGAYSLALEVTAPHGGLPLHSHSREDEAMYILEGEYEIQCGEQVFRAGPGALVFLPRGIANRYQNVTDLPARFLYITTPGGFERFIDQLHRIATSGPPDMERIKETARNHGIEFR